MNGLMAKLGAPADLSQHSPHASVQQLLHATKSLTELNAGSALGHLQVQHHPSLFMCILATPASLRLILPPGSSPLYIASSYREPLTDYQLLLNHTWRWGVSFSSTHTSCRVGLMHVMQNICHTVAPFGLGTARSLRSRMILPNAYDLRPYLRPHL